MHPTIFDLAFFGRILAIDAHGLCLTLGALAGLVMTSVLARRQAYSSSEIRELALELVLVGILGARVLYLTTHLFTYATVCRFAIATDEGALWTCARPLWIWEGGLSFYGGLIAALGWLAWRAPRRGLAPLRIADLAAPGLALAYAIARVGCFLAGCCFGRVTECGLGLRFPPESAAFQLLLDRGAITRGSEATPPLHPVQLYTAVAHTLLCVALLVVSRRRTLAPGRVFIAFLVGHLLIRVLVLPFSDFGG